MKGKITVGSDAGTLYNYISRESAGSKYLCSNIASDDHVAHQRMVHALRPDVKKPNLHLMLRLCPGDRELADNEWKEIVEYTLRKLEMDTRKHSYVAFKHGKDHVHIMASRVAIDTSLWHGKWSAEKLLRVTPEIERLYDLNKTKSLQEHREHNRVRSLKLTRKQYEQNKRTLLPVPKQLLAEHIERALEISGGSWGKFALELRRRGIAPEVIERANGSKGLRFEYAGKSFKASSLGKQYGYSGITRSLEALASKDSDPHAPVKPKTVNLAKEPIELVAERNEVREKDQTAEDREYKRTTLERLEKLRIDCPEAILVDVEIMYFLIRNRMFKKLFYLLALLKVAALEDEYKFLRTRARRINNAYPRVEIT